MPSQPACFHRLDEILADLLAIESTHLDRRAVQRLFRVPQRRARQIMASLDPCDKAYLKHQNAGFPRTTKDSHLGMAVVIVSPVSRTLTSPRLLLWTSTA